MVSLISTVKISLDLNHTNSYNTKTHHINARQKHPSNLLQWLPGFLLARLKSVHSALYSLRLVNLCHVTVHSALLISHNKVKATDIAVTSKVKISKNRNMNIAISR